VGGIFLRCIEYVSDMIFGGYEHQTAGFQQEKRSKKEATR